MPNSVAGADERLGEVLGAEQDHGRGEDEERRRTVARRRRCGRRPMQRRRADEVGLLGRAPCEMRIVYATKMATRMTASISVIECFSGRVSE